MYYYVFILIVLAPDVWGIINYKRAGRRLSTFICHEINDYENIIKIIIILL